MIGLRSRAAHRGAVKVRAQRRAEGSVSRLTWLVLSVCALNLTGCGAAAYSYHVVRAARSVEQAKQVGAEQLAPYEMTLAQAYLGKAREESAEASYQDAVHYAKLSRSIADRATERSRVNSKGRGR